MSELRNIKIKQGLLANINSTATKNSAQTGELHYCTDSKALYMFDGANNVLLHQSKSYVAKTSAYTVLVSDYIIDCTSGTFTLTLPTAVGITGYEFIIKNSGTGAITIDGDGSETIDGGTTATLSTQYEMITIISDGANWIIGT